MREMSRQVQEHFDQVAKFEMSLRTLNQELSASESRYRGLVDHAPIGIFTTKGMHVTFTNRHNRILAGLDPDEQVDPASFRARIHPGDLDRALSDLVNEVLKLLNGPLEAKHLNVRPSLSPPADRLHVYRDQIERVLLNVIGNTIDASPVDGSVLEITGQESSHHEQSGVVIQIRDAGKGIAAAALARASNHFSRRGNAMGLGEGLLSARTS